jgi:hypothetical protein
LHSVNATVCIALCVATPTDSYRKKEVTHAHGIATG